jgi:hypothetical protein
MLEALGVADSGGDAAAWVVVAAAADEHALPEERVRQGFILASQRSSG